MPSMLLQVEQVLHVLIDQHGIKLIKCQKEGAQKGMK
jgi:hypothetical protein